MIESSSLSSIPIELEINGRPFICSPEHALQPLLDFVRLQSGLKGTKEGCRTGECGACMVLLASPEGWQAVNSCVYPMGQAHGQQVVTIEGVGDSITSILHPAQEAMISCRASQCGFCTPGMVMSLASLQTFDHESGEADRKPADLQAALSGNLCRCTGYRPILDAAARLTSRRPTVQAPLQTPLRHTRFPANSRCHAGRSTYFAPGTLDQLLALRQDHPGAALLGGGTDLMTHWLETGSTPRTVISTMNVDVMDRVTMQSSLIRIGASVSMRRVFQVLIEPYPELEEYFRRFASPAINAVATLAGNLQTASPIGDMIPLMMVLGASVELASATSVRSIPVEKFYRGYRTTDFGPDEVITAVLVPVRRPGQHVFAYKVAKRFDQDISALTLVAALTMGGTTVDEAAICYGGMSGIVHRASQTEAALIGRVFDNASVEEAILCLHRDYSPVSDLRGSSDYRRQVAANLLRKSVIDYNGTEPTSIWQLSRR